MMIAGRIQRYIFRQSVMGLMLTLGIIVLAILLVDVVEQMRTIGERTEISIVTAFRLTLLKTPNLLMETLPFAMLIGSILTYSQLNKRSEISAIRAAGISAWRFIAPATFLAASIGVLMVVVIDPMATRFQETFETERAELLGQNRVTGNTSGIWLSQGNLNAKSDIAPLESNDTDSFDPEAQAIIHAKTVIGRAEALEDVTFYYYRSGPGGVNDREFNYRIDAAEARLVPGFWQLKGVVESHVGGNVNRQDSLALPTNLRADTLFARYASSKNIPFWELPGFIQSNRASGMNVDSYVVKFHSLLATPVLMAAMAMIGAVVCLRLARSGGLSQLIGAGALSGFILFFVTRIAADLSISGAAPPEAAAWCPPLFALFAVLTIVAHAEDG